MKFVIEINCDNSAFGLDCDDVVNADCCAEVARIVSHAMTYIADGETDAACFDANGNRVGFARFAAEGR